MQRRAVAAYVVFFLLLGASSYAIIAVAEKPSIDLSGETYGAGESFTVGGQSYTVSSLNSTTSGGEHGGGGEAVFTGEVTYVNESYRHSAVFENETNVSAEEIQWPGQTGRHTATLQDGQTITFNGSERQVDIRDGSTLALVGPNQTASFTAGDTLVYRRNSTTVERISTTEADLVWGYAYQVLIPNETAPSTFTFDEQLNVSDILRLDPAVYDETVTVDGEERIVYRSNNSTAPLGSYLPDPERKSFTEGETLVYRGTEVDLVNVTTEAVILEWTGPKEETIELSQGANVTLSGQPYVAYFESSHAVTLSPDVAGYQEQVRQQERFVDRIGGLWWVTMLSGFAAILVVGLAYLPVRG